ncbi:MAG: hypothetical protein LH609_20075 [Rudanella sp.]|nr:hypothetical protein [Rudanella sp.]
MRLIVVTQPSAEEPLSATALESDAPPLRLPETAYLSLLLHYPSGKSTDGILVGEEWWPLEPLAPGWWIARDQLTDESVRVRFEDVAKDAPLLTLRPSFRNRFGQCRLSFPADDGPPILLGMLQISTSKASEEQLSRMLTYLWERQSNWFDGQSRVGIDYLLPPDSMLGTLARLRADLLFLHRQQPLFRLMPQTRLLPTRQRLSAPRPDQLTESALTYVLDNPYCLEPVESAGADTLTWQGRAYRLRETETDLLQENTDTPENRLLHGYLIDVGQYLLSLPDTIRNAPLPGETGWQQNVMARRIGTEATRLLRLINDWQYFADEYLPVSRPEFILPNSLTGFEHSDHYRHTGRLIRTWFSSGRAVGLGAETALTGIRSVDKLYELFCLHRWLDAWQTMGYVWKLFVPATGGNVEADRRNADPGFYHLHHPNGHRAMVAYDCLPPHYQITVPYKKSMPLRPDFLIEWTPAEGQAQYLIADAKFRPAFPMREHELPTLVMKYVNGISPDRNHRSAPLSRGLLLLHPAVPPNFSVGREGFWFLQFPRFDWFGDQPAMIQIGQVAVSVDNTDDYLGVLLNRWVQ